MLFYETSSCVLTEEIMEKFNNIKDPLEDVIFTINVNFCNIQVHPSFFKEYLNNVVDNNNVKIESYKMQNGWHANNVIVNMTGTSLALFEVLKKMDFTGACHGNIIVLDIELAA